MFNRILAVFDKTLRDIKKATIVIDVILQVVMLLTSSYNCFKQFGNWLLFVPNAIIVAISLAYLVYFLAKKGNGNVIVKKIIGWSKIASRAMIVGFDLYAVLFTPTTMLDKLLKLFTFASLALTIIFNIVSSILTYYINLFIVAVGRDLDDFATGKTAFVLGKIGEKLTGVSDEIVAPKKTGDKTIDQVEALAHERAVHMMETKEERKAEGKAKSKAKVAAVFASISERMAIKRERIRAEKEAKRGAKKEETHAEEPSQNEGSDENE